MKDWYERQERVEDRRSEMAREALQRIDADLLREGLTRLIEDDSTLVDIARAVANYNHAEGVKDSERAGNVLADQLSDILFEYLREEFEETAAHEVGSEDLARELHIMPESL